jgi:hypothetical protein
MVRRAFWIATTPQELTPAELPERYVALVLGYVSALLGAGPEAEDITLSVFGEACARPKICPRGFLPKKTTPCGPI